MAKTTFDTANWGLPEFRHKIAQIDPHIEGYGVGRQALMQIVISIPDFYSFSVHWLNVIIKRPQMKVVETFKNIGLR